MKREASHTQLSNEKYTQKMKERMERAREEKERVRLLTERGSEQLSAGKPSRVVAKRSPQQVRAMREDSQVESPEEPLRKPQEQEEDREPSSNGEGVPLLFVDVNLGGLDHQQPERIIVMEGDTARDLARQFCEKHNLDEETEERLTELLQQQISSVLTKIQEEEDGSPELHQGSPE